jgi:hypothetical protein
VYGELNPPPPPLPLGALHLAAPTGVGDLQNFCTPLYPHNTYNMQFFSVVGFTVSQIQV